MRLADQEVDLAFKIVMIAVLVGVLCGELGIPRQLPQGHGCSNVITWSKRMGKL
jgi:hypothetical protein